MDHDLPELSGRGQRLLRIPSELDVALTPRVLALLDTPAMQRLRRISQLGLVSYVYPGAIHSRFEHSLGVYHLACKTLQHLLNNEREFAARVSPEELKIFLLAALLHDVGHWPYCHPIEDLRLTELPHHEQLARTFLCNGDLGELIADQWQLDPRQVADFIAGRTAHTSPVLQNLLNGPVDIDKMDYLQRDSLHAGVPYGRNFDVARLISSLCIADDGVSIALTEKGKTAAEMMVFARYVMFSEVYWHHAVRSATAMLQRLVFHLRDRLISDELRFQSDATFGSKMIDLAREQVALLPLAEGLFGENRRLYKRLAQFNFSDSPQVFDALARRPYSELEECATRLIDILRGQYGLMLEPHDILIDAPPVKLEVQFRIAVRRSVDVPRQARTVSLADLSPVVRALATQQFDSYVKRVRVFIAASRASQLELTHQRWEELLLQATEGIQ